MKSPISLALALLLVASCAEAQTVGGGQGGNPGPAASASNLVGCVYNAAGVAPDSNRPQVGLQCDSSGNLKIGGTSAATTATNTTAIAATAGTTADSACATSSTTPCSIPSIERGILAAVQSTAPVAVYPSTASPTSGTTAAMTGTTSTLLLAAPGANLRNYITTLSCVNSHATVGTFVTVQDGSGGTALFTLAAASVFGGNTVTFPVPLKQPTANTGLYVVDVTTGANVICSGVGFTG